MSLSLWQWVLRLTPVGWRFARLEFGIGNIFKFSSLFSSPSHGGHKFKFKLLSRFCSDFFLIGPIHSERFNRSISERPTGRGSAAAAVRPTRVRFKQYFQVFKSIFVSESWRPQVQVSVLFTPTYFNLTGPMPCPMIHELTVCCSHRCKFKFKLPFCFVLNVGPVHSELTQENAAAIAYNAVGAFFASKMHRTS